MTLALYGKSRRRQVRLLALALFAVMGATLFAVGEGGQGPTDASAVELAPSTFEIDGDMADSDGGGPKIDWATPPPNYTVANEVCDNSAETQHDDNDTINDPPGPEGSTTSTIEIGPVQAKNDFCQAQYAFEFIDSDIFLYLSWTRIADNGTGVIYFELNQSSTPAAGAGGLIERTVGDVMIVYDYQGGGTPVIGYRTWGGSSWGAVQTIPAAVAANADTNLFGEAAIKLDDIFTPTNGEECGGFANVTLHSTTGNSDTSTLQDVLGPTPLVVNNCPNINIVKTNDSDPAGVPGGTVVSFNLAITVGNAAVADVDVVDVLPEHITGATNISNGGVYAAGPNTITWTDLDLPAGVTNLTYDATVSVGAPAGDHVNVATVTHEVCEDPASDCEDDSTVTVVRPALEIRKTPDGGVIDAGQDAVFTLTVENTSDVVALGVDVTDDLPNTPPGITWSETSPDCTLTGNLLECLDLTIAGNSSFTVVVTGTTTGQSEGQTAPATCGVIDNTGSFTSDNDGSGEDPGDITVRCAPGLTTTASGSADPLSVGDTTSDVANFTEVGGFGEVTGTVDFFLCDPTEVAANGGDCSAGGTQYGNNVAVSGNEAESLDSAALGAGTYCWRAEFTPAVESNYLATSHTNDDTECVTVLEPSLDIDKELLTASPAGPGDTITFSITITNTGQGTAKTVSLNDPLVPAGGWSVDSDTWDGVCTIVAGAINCPAQDLGPGGTLVVTVSMIVDSQTVCGPHTNTATADATNIPGSPDATDSADVDVKCAPTIVTDVIPDAPNVINLGESFTDTITVTGPGGQPAPTGTVDVFLCGPTPTAENCDDGGSLTDNDLALGEESTEQTPTEPGFYCYRIVYSGDDNYVGATHFNSTTECVEVRAPDITIVKDPFPADGEAEGGDEIGFDIIVSNANEADTGTAADVELDDTLPAGFTWDFAVGGNPSHNGVPNPDCTITGGQTLHCDFGDLAPGESVTVQVRAATTQPTSPTDPGATCGTFRNVATVSGTNFEEENDDATVIVRCAPILSTDVDLDMISVGESVVDSATISGFAGLGPVQGGIQFFYCADTDEPFANPVCTIPTSTFIGAVAVNGDGTYDSNSVSPDLAGNYCFLARFVPDEGSEYLEVIHTNQTTECFQVREPGLTISKDADNEQPVNAGDPIGFTITVSNTGEGTAFDVTLNDPLPGGDGVDWSIESQSGGANCTIQGAHQAETLVCGGTDFDLETGESFTVHVVSDTTADSCKEFVNFATADASNSSEVTANATETVLCPDIDVDKTGSTGPVSAGDPITFQITVLNLGPGVAYGVMFEDDLGALGLVNVLEDHADCGVIAGVIMCDFGDMGAGESEVVNITADTTPASCAGVDNEVTVTSTNENFFSLGNNTDDHVIEVDCPDIEVEKTSNGTINAGEVAEFTITVRNIGAGTAAPVHVFDAFPSALTWTDDRDECAIGEFMGMVVIECLFDEIAPGGEEVIVLTSTTPADGSVCGPLHNEVIAFADNEPEDVVILPENGELPVESQAGVNFAEADIEVLCPDVQVEKDADAETAAVGDEVTFTITVTALGNDTAENVIVTDTLPGPASMEWTVDPECVPGNPVAGGTEITCDLGSVAPGEPETITITGTIEACEDLTNQATVTADADVDPSNNTSELVTIEVDCPDITVTKTGTALINPGDPVSYTIVVRNDGPGTAQGVTLTDTMPLGAPSWTVGGADAADCAPNPVAGGALLTCDFGDLVEDAIATITLSGVTPDTGECGPLTNVATVAALNEIENDILPNTDDHTINCVLATGNLVIRKFIDYDGDRSADPIDELDSGWEITIACEGEAVQVIDTGANGVGTIIILGLDEGTECTVSEDQNSKDGFEVVGFNSNDAGGADTGPGTSAVVTIDETVEAEVDFFNQPFGDIIIEKQTLRNGGNEPGQNGGWEITVEGCGISETKDTVQGNPVGTVSFLHLPACPSGYEVSEDPNSKPAENPPFSPIGGTSEDVDLSPGETETVEFTNARNDPPPEILTPTPTPTNTPTATPTNTPTATPTNTPTNTPTPIDTVLGEKTPAPPETGSGFTDTLGGSSANLLMAVAGLVAMAGGFLLLAGHRRRDDR